MCAVNEFPTILLKIAYRPHFLGDLADSSCLEVVCTCHNLPLGPISPRKLYAWGRMSFVENFLLPRRAVILGKLRRRGFAAVRKSPIHVRCSARASFHTRNHHPSGCREARVRLKGFLGKKSAPMNFTEN